VDKKSERNGSGIVRLGISQVMQRASWPGHALRIALAALVSLAIAPAAGAEDGLFVPVDPTALAAALVEPVTAPVTVTPVTVDPAAAVATVTDSLSLSTPAQPAQALPAAAATPIPALEPQPTPIGTPPPPEPGKPPPAAAPDPAPTAAAAPAPEPHASPEPQYQPESTQYQPLDTLSLPAEPAPSPAPPRPVESSSGLGWHCNAPSLPDAIPAPGDGFPTIWNRNWQWNCERSPPLLVNSALQSQMQYQLEIPRYHLLGASVSIPARSPAIVDATPILETVEALTRALAPQPADTVVADAPPPAADPSARASPDAAPAKTRPPPAPAFTILSSSWTPRHATPRPVQPKPDVHRSRPAHRRLTRHPLPPLRGPEIPVSPSGAAPLGGADGGGFLSLLLAPLALVLVDSARRVARDTAPPVARERDKRRKRPG
jgi:hypothetical protein